MIHRSRLAEAVALAGLLIIAAGLRWSGLAWDSGYLFHPDERQILLVVSNLHLPSNLLDFFSPDSPLNPKFFAYGSLPICLLRALIPFAPPTNLVGPWADDQLARWVLMGRWLSGLFDLGTIALTYALGRRVYDARVGLLAAACVTVSVLHIQLAHFYAVDTLLTFFTVATLYAALRLADRTENANRRESKPISTNSRESKTFRVDSRGFAWIRVGKVSVIKHHARAGWTSRNDKFPNWDVLWHMVCGILFGLALATKITALPLLAPIAYACYRTTDAPPLKFSRARFMEIWRALRRPFLKIVGVALLVFVVTQPYALIDWYSFGRDVGREMFVARGWLDYPYTRQFTGTLPVIYQVWQSSLWGMGLPLGIFAWGGAALFLLQWWKGRAWRDTLLLSFALIYFLGVAFQFAKYMRYLLPLLPVLYIIAACAWRRILEKKFVRARLVFSILAFSILAVAFLYSLAFIQIYTREHPWLVASRWIYENIPAGKTLTVEEWDDALPVLIQFPKGARRGSEYNQITLTMYDDDTDAKRRALANALRQADVVVLASQRLYGSIGRNPTRYPLTNRYYEKLFSGELGFAPAITTRNDPNLFGVTIRDNPFAGLTFDPSTRAGQAVSRINARLSPDETRVWDWGFADESFSVYDHPQPIVFQKTRALSAEEIENLLQP
ncbi:MAG: glycosyltransferase family 39 protein [Chloroflexi bacterium]|nr:glycosyltransferase family 39 protein [Chloroflexota bacterium]